MLWMKSWLETRWRLLYALGLPLAALALRAVTGLASTKDARAMLGVVSCFSIFAAVYLAGAGIRTQPGFQMTKGLHGSTYFTLSLPVSRLRLLGVRAGCGLWEIAGINAMVISSAWIIFPLVRGDSTPFDLLRSILSAIVCTACFYFLSVFLATFLEESWHTFGSIFVVGLAWLCTIKLSLTPSVNIFSFWTDASPLVRHTLPWPALAISVAISVILFVAALKVVQNREY